MNATEKAANRLINEPSPYLQQHAHNPVDWWPWCGEAFERAAAEDKPVFLSIGYSSCHWCHVMERETFSDPKAAEYLNRACVSIKVDREERPDVDAVYMDACVALTGSGGWPLTVFMTPEKHPFFAGTYYPNKTFIDLTNRVSHLWREERERLLEASDGLVDALQSRRAGPGRDMPLTAETAEAMARAAFVSLAKGYDAQYGGFGPAPKFPSAHTLMFLERYGQLHPGADARAMARYTLERMALGGLQDHVGGGFFRYSTDRFYRIPHFEKMLYDNAQLMTVYAEAGLEAAARRTLEFCTREMRSPEGAFYAALDADSDHREGAYYLLSPADLTPLGADAKRYAELYDITDAGNYEGLNLPNLLVFGPLPDEDRELAGRCNAQLLAARAERVPPMRDEKVLLGWNGLMLGALATCGRLWRDQEVIGEARTLAAFLRDNFRRDGRWHGVWYEGSLGEPKATSDDYAYFAWGLYRLHQATLDDAYLTLCAEVLGEMLELFGDADGLMYLAGSDVTDLPLRTKNTQDGALPSGNAIAAGTLRRLGLLTGEERWLTASDRLTSALMAEARQYPAAYPAAISAALLGAHGRKAEVPHSGVLREAADRFHPYASIKGAGGDTDNAARVCTPGACLPPTEDADVFLRMITPPFGNSK